MSIPRSQHTATLLQDGRILLVGRKGADLFNPNTETFRATTGTPTNRKGHAALRLPDGSVLITGGYVDRKASKSAEVFDPLAEAFTSLPATMLVPRANHAMAPLPDGHVLVTGGFSGTSPHDEVDIFDSIQQTFVAG